MKTDELKELIGIREVLINCCERYLQELRDPNITGTAMVKQAEVGPFISDALQRIDSILRENDVQFAE